ncbi:MAG: lysine--tRNA ligase [Candidatus Levybacteria bacterium RIFCSPHIGHO2_01_FULL_36_15b]|nr:MAG: lysine--tRNA ligase [Candidatus Levybacteria bacterium RIFCSPHIGHO2_01_FULL_36_15b]
MFWADKLLENIKGKQVINDSFTPSGIVHMGSLKGPVIHDTLAKILKEKKTEVEFRYGFDDMDPIDGLPANLMDSHGKYLGEPLFMAPGLKKDETFGDHFSKMMENLLKDLDIKPDILYRTSVLYKEGVFDKAIRIVLDDVEKVRAVYEEMYKKKLSDSWYPFQVICPNCKKLGTTKVTNWDGKEVEYECLSNLVVWAKGCGEKGKVSPFKGNGKMVWKVEWAAKWFTFGVTIEGAGKDHASAGGSYDIAMELVEKVFNAKKPMKLAYEFFLAGGKKMSSSKGLGITGDELLEVIGPQRTRFLMVKTEPNIAVEFSPKDSLAIPSLFDQYQAFSKSDEEDHKRVIYLSQANEQEDIPQTRFSTIAQLVQMPNTQNELKEVKDWVQYAKIWIEKYAPESEKFIIQKGVPQLNFSDQEKNYLKIISERLAKVSSEVDLAAKLYEWSAEGMLTTNQAFAAIYKALLGKDHGPKAAALIRSLDQNFVKKRFEEISKL